MGRKINIETRQKDGKQEYKTTVEEKGITKVFNAVKKGFSLVVDRKRRYFVYQAQQFADRNPNALIILGDPETDVLVSFYKGKVVAAQIKNDEGKQMQVIKKMLQPTNKKDNERAINTFLLFVDGALYNLGMALKGQKPKDNSLR